MCRRSWGIWIVLGVLLALGLTAGLGMPFFHGWGYGHGWGMMGGFGFPMFGMPLMWLFLIVCGVWVVQSLSRADEHDRPTQQKESPLEILNRRYASGEITREQFEQAKRDLGF